MNREEIKEILNEMFEKYNNMVVRHINGKKYLKIKKSILKETKYLPKESTMRERVYHILNDLYERPICPQCKKNNINFNNGKYYTYCSIQCCNISPIEIEKTKKTCQEKYGKSNYFQTNEFKEKSIQTVRKKYKCDHNLQNKEIKEKRKQTMMYKYNCEHPLQNKEIKEKMKHKNRKKLLLKIKKLFKSQQLKLIHESEFIYSVTDIKLKCLKCGKEFKSNYFNIQQGKRCPYCSTEYFQSKEENELYDYLKLILPNTEIIQNETQLIRNPITNHPLELDIYIPEKKIAIEYNGLYWHSEKHQVDNYHLMKTELCKEKGIQLIHIFEDEWKFKKDVVKHKLKQILISDNEKINLDECKIKEINKRLKDKFLKKYHIEGKNNSDINLGLFYNNELISLAAFSDQQNDIFNLERKNSKYNINGIENKLLEYFKKNYNWKEINLYIDLRWSNGNIYEQLEFVLEKQIKPKIWWFYNSYLKRIKNSDFIKEKHKNEYLKIYDCGYLKYKLTNKGNDNG